jgi:hypothetical protein
MAGVTDDRNDPELNIIDPENNMQMSYLVLSEEERAKGFVRPLRRSYVHAVELGGCGVATKMGPAIAETYARNPSYYGGTYCVGCRDHFPVGEHGQFLWDDDSNEKVGT